LKKFQICWTYLFIYLLKIVDSTNCLFINIFFVMLFILCGYIKLNIEVCISILFSPLFLVDNTTLASLKICYLLLYYLCFCEIELLVLIRL
jgi:hypothetical protein